MPHRPRVLMIGVDAADIEFIEAAADALPNLRRIFRDVLSIGDVFPRARSHLLPDLVVRWEDRPQATQVRSDTLGAFSARPDNGRCGEHRSRGWATLLGPQCRRAAAARSLT